MNQTEPDLEIIRHFCDQSGVNENKYKTTPKYSVYLICFVCLVMIQLKKQNQKN